MMISYMGENRLDQYLPAGRPLCARRCPSVVTLDMIQIERLQNRMDGLEFRVNGVRHLQTCLSI